MVAEQKVIDRVAVERALEIEITGDVVDGVRDRWQVAGWLAPSGEAAKVAYMTERTDQLLPAAHVAVGGCLP